MDLGHAPNVDKASEENEGQRRSVIFQKDANWMSEETATAKFTTDVSNHEEQQSRNDGEVEGTVTT